MLVPPNGQMDGLQMVYNGKSQSQTDDEMGVPPPNLRKPQSHHFQTAPRGGYCHGWSLGLRTAGAQRLQGLWSSTGAGTRWNTMIFKNSIDVQHAPLISFYIPADSIHFDRFLHQLCHYVCGTHIFKHVCHRVGGISWECHGIFG